MGEQADNHLHSGYARSGVIGLSMALAGLFFLTLLANATQPRAQDTQSPRIGTVVLVVFDQDGRLLANAPVSYSQISHDFLFGTGSTHPSGRYPFSVYEALNAIGINYTLPFLSWRTTEPNPGRYDWDTVEYLYYVGELDNRGFTLNAHCFIWLNDGWYNLPEYMREVGFEEFVARAYTHTLDIVTHYKDKIDMWTINEPIFPYSVLFNFTEDQWVELCRVVIQAIRRADPDAQVMVNMWPSDIPSRNYYPIPFLRRLVDQGIDYDVIGMELWPLGVRVLNKRTLSRCSPCKVPTGTFSPLQRPV